MVTYNHKSYARSVTYLFNKYANITHCFVYNLMISSWKMLEQDCFMCYMTSGYSNIVLYFR